MSAKDEGLHEKYYVVRADGIDKPGSRYFVLDYGRDPIAREALKTYIEEADANGYHELAEDLLDELFEVRQRQAMERDADGA